MRFSIVFAGTSALALAACSVAPETVEDPSDPDQVAAAVEGLPTLQPGLYTETAELVEAELTGGTEEERASFSALAQSETTEEREFCRTEEDTSGGAEALISSLNELPDQCEMDALTVDGNTLDANMTCSGEMGEAVTAQVSGTVSETSSDLTVTMDFEIPINDQSMRMVIRQQSERTGDCPAAG